MNDIGTFMAKILLVIYYWIEGIILYFLPNRFTAKDVTGEIVLITGAGSGIGRLMSIRFAQKGAILVLWDVNGKANQETAIMIKENGGKAYAYQVDITDKDSVYKVADQVKKEVGDVTILINNAGIVIGKNILDLDDKQVEKVFNVNTISHFWIIKSFIGNMMQNNHGHIVTIASLAGLGGMPKLSDYCASKFAAIGLLDSIYIEMNASGYNNIHTTTVCPFFINTGMFSGVESKIFSLLEPEYVADEIVAGILSNKEMIFIPRCFYFINVIKSIMPARSLLALYEACGGFESMKEFVGRRRKLL